ncbi:hypothetical protein BKA70DRAFT_272378 [Coprinopsis sp. MPI-PUGE-AT-0042]|nr:hypothetical protein BKA70DRAFT_272378 [Coprinopsis sp. MPI-PUGE-AT-0042]
MADLVQSSRVQAERSRSTKFYFQNAIIDVEGTLYSISKEILASQSPVFEGMFAVGDRSAGEGASDDKPIVLEGYKSEDFECLLSVILPQPFQPFPLLLNKQEWISVLKLATIWQMDNARNVAIDKLSSLELSPIEKIQHGSEYHVSAWFKEGIAAIASDFYSYKMEEIGNILGWRTTALILCTRDKAKPKASHEWTKDWVCIECGAAVEGRSAGSQRQAHEQTVPSRCGVSVGENEGRSL